MSVNPWKSTPQWIGAIICRRFSKVSHRFEAKMWGLSLLAIFTFRQTAKQSVFLRIQVCTSSQTKGLERGWKQRARLGRDAFSPASHALRGCEDRALRTRKTLTPRFTLCVFMGNLSSKTLKYHISLMTYDLKFFAPLRTRRHTMAANEGVTEATESFTKMIQILSFLTFLMIYVPILYLPTFSESNAWDFHLVMTGISGDVPATSEDLWRLSEVFQTLPKMSPDLPKTFEQFRSHLKDDNFSVLCC